MIVQELINLLITQPRTASVIIEGCDCYGVADGVKYYESIKCVAITRGGLFSEPFE